MDKFLDDEFEKIESENIKIEQVNYLAGEQYLEHIEEVQKIAVQDDLKPRLINLNYITLLNDKRIGKNDTKKLEKRKL